MTITTIKPFAFFRKLRSQHYGLRHSLELISVLKRYGHCYCKIDGEKALFLKA
jgi:hypothetical protein